MNTTYEIFARKEHPEPLTYVGPVEAADDGDVIRIALETYGPASEWLEMVAVPRQAVLVVFSEQGEKANEQ